MTVRGFMVGDEYEGLDVSDEIMRAYERGFRQLARHVGCQICYGNNWAQRAFVFPRNGFSEFPLDFVPGVVQSGKAV